MYKIESNIEIPESRTKYPFDDMEVGDSILFPKRKAADSARVAAVRFAQAHRPGWKFSLRTVEDGWRLWRVA